MSMVHVILQRWSALLFWGNGTQAEETTIILLP